MGGGMSWHSHYQKGSVGNILHFLYHVCKFDVAEHALIGAYHVEYWGRTMATFTYDENDFPIFKFIDQEEKYFQDRIESWRNNQDQRRLEAIEDWKQHQEDTKPERIRKQFVRITK